MAFPSYPVKIWQKMSISGTFFPYLLYQGPDKIFGEECLRVLIMFQLTYSTTFKSKYLPAYGVFKLSGQNMSQNATKKLNPIYRKMLTLLYTHNLISPPIMTQPNVFFWYPINIYAFGFTCS
jgi:hypothetical protein